jgi:hypothetical protein
MKRETILQQSAELIYAYFEAYKLLPEGSQKDVLYTATFVEGLVFRCISDICIKYGIATNNKLLRSDYITAAAKEQIEQKNMKNLIREHMIPKTVYFNILIDQSKKGLLTKEQIFNILNKNYWTCLVTKDEDKSLSKQYKSKMPDDWDGINIFVRYEKVSINGVEKNSKRVIF